MRTNSSVNYWIIAQETRQNSAIPTGYVHVQPAERAERPPCWHTSLKVPFIMFVFIISCGTCAAGGCSGSFPLSCGLPVRPTLSPKTKPNFLRLWASNKHQGQPRVVHTQPPNPGGGAKNLAAMWGGGTRASRSVGCGTECAVQSRTALIVLSRGAERCT